jgi:hypothetical protein
VASACASACAVQVPNNPWLSGACMFAALVKFRAPTYSGLVWLCYSFVALSFLVAVTASARRAGLPGHVPRVESTSSVDTYTNRHAAAHYSALCMWRVRSLDGDARLHSNQLRLLVRVLLILLQVLLCCGRGKYLPRRRPPSEPGSNF